MAKSESHRTLNRDALYNFICTLEKDTNNRKTLNDLVYDNVPLWWFYKNRFLRDGLPRPFDNFDIMLRIQEDPMRKKIHLIRKRIGGLMLACGMVLNEKLKCLFARRSTPISPAPKSRPRVLFLAHSVAIDMKKAEDTTDQEFSIDRIDPVFRAVQKETTLDVKVLIIDAMSQPASRITAAYPHFFHQYVDVQVREIAKGHAHRLHQEWLCIKKEWRHHNENSPIGIGSPYEKRNAFFTSEIPHVNFRYPRAKARGFTGSPNEWGQAFGIENRCRSKTAHFSAPIFDKMFSLFEPALDFFFSAPFISIVICYYETFKKIFSQTQTRALVVYTSAGVLDMCALKAAECLGIPTISLSHGMGMSLSNTAWIYGKNNFFLVNSPFERNNYIAKGAPRKNITAIGPVTFTEIYAYQQKAKQRNKEFARKKNEEYSKILFCTSPMVQEGILGEEDYFADISKIICGLAGVNKGRCEIVIKPHPLEKLKYVGHYRNIIKSGGYKNIKLVGRILGKKLLYEEIAVCDVLVCFFSTVIFEASILNKPVILIEMYNRQRIDESGQFYKNSDAIIKIKPKEPIRMVVENVLYNNKLRRRLEIKRKAFNRLFCYRTDAKAPARAAACIKKRVISMMAKNKQKQRIGPKPRLKE